MIKATSKLKMMLGALALVAALGTESASALTAVDSTTMNPLPVGSRINAHNMGSTGFTGTFFGTTVKVVCTTSSATGTVKTNDLLGTSVAVQLDSLSFTGCVNGSGNPCTLTTNGLPWDPHNADAAWDEGGMIASSTSSIDMGTGSNSITMSGSTCLPFGTTCDFRGTGSTLAVGGDSIDNRVQGSWTNSSTDNQMNLVNAVVTSSVCGTGTWTTGFTIRTGSTVGSGNLVWLQ